MYFDFETPSLSAHRNQSRDLTQGRSILRKFVFRNLSPVEFHFLALTKPPLLQLLHSLRARRNTQLNKHKRTTTINWSSVGALIMALNTLHKHTHARTVTAIRFERRYCTLHKLQRWHPTKLVLIITMSYSCKFSGVWALRQLNSST